jgi:hypothetical protein
LNLLPLIDTSGIAEGIRNKLGLLVTGAAVVGHKIKEVSKEVQRVTEKEGRWNIMEKVMNCQVP